MITAWPAFFLLVDEAAQAALGFAAPPQEFPWQTHARRLAGTSFSLLFWQRRSTSSTLQRDPSTASKTRLAASCNEIV